MSTVKDYINEMICDIKEGKVIGTGGETFDFLKYMRSNPNNKTSIPSETTGYSYDYNVEIPVWGDSIRYLKVKTLGKNQLDILIEEKDKITGIIELVNDSKQKILEAIAKMDVDTENIKTAKVTGILLDYSCEKTEYSFFVNSGEAFSFHVYILDDMSFKAGYIS